MNNSISAIKIPVISGSGRSGTTWVLDALAQANELRPVFEPLHPVIACAMSQYTGKYIHGEEINNELEQYLANIFSGEFKNIWIDYRVRPDRLMPYYNNFTSYDGVKEFFARWVKLYRQYKKYRIYLERPVIVKFIRANLMHDWLISRFDTRIAHVKRHPCAVIESKLRLGGDDWNVDTELNRYIMQPEISNWINKYIHVSENTELTDVEKHAIIWAVENESPYSKSLDRKPSGFLLRKPGK